MKISVNVSHYFIAYSSLLAFTMAAGRMAVKKKDGRNRSLFVLFFCLGIMQSYGFMMTSGLIFKAPFLLHFNTPFIYACGPALYFFFLATFEADRQMRRTEFLHFVPAVASLILLIPRYFEPVDVKVVALERFLVAHEPSLYDSLTIAGILVIAIYIGFIGYRLWPLWNSNRENPDLKVKVFFFMVAASVLTMVALAIAFTFKERSTIGNVLAGVILLSIYLSEQRYPAFFQALQVKYHEQKYARSLLKENDISHIEKELARLVEDEKIYIEDDLSLPALAAKIGTGHHLLSEYLNSKLGTSYSQYVNHLRIKDACEKLLAEPGKPVLNIAYEVGFNSKSVFHNAFQKETGLSPLAYRKKHGS